MPRTALMLAYLDSLQARADEVITAYVILQCPLVSENVLKDVLSRIDVVLEAYSVGIRPGVEGEDAPKGSTKELLDSHTLESNDDPVIAVGSTNEGADNAEDDEHKQIYVLWKHDLHIRSYESSTFTRAGPLTRYRPYLQSHNKSITLPVDRGSSSLATSRF